MMFGWFGTVIRESEAGIYNEQVDRSFRWGMGWFIFSEVMFFAAFFGALYYARQLAIPWLAGDMFTLGDIAMAPFVERMMDLRGDLVSREAFPAVYDWFDRLRERPAHADLGQGGRDRRIRQARSAI